MVTDKRKREIKRLLWSATPTELLRYCEELEVMPVFLPLQRFDAMATRARIAMLYHWIEPRNEVQ